MQTKFAIFVNLCGKNSQIPDDVIKLIINEVGEMNKGDVWQVGLCGYKGGILLRHKLGPTLC